MTEDKFASQYFSDKAVLTLLAWADFAEDNNLGYEKELRFLAEFGRRPVFSGCGKWEWWSGDDTMFPSSIKPKYFCKMKKGKLHNTSLSCRQYETAAEAIIDAALAMGYVSHD